MWSRSSALGCGVGPLAHWEVEQVADAVEPGSARGAAGARRRGRWRLGRRRAGGGRRSDVEEAARRRAGAGWRSAAGGRGCVGSEAANG
jgi:hypothetical protein